jgi:hypothetical protein
MVPKLGFGKTTGLGPALWQSNIGKYFQLSMSRGVLLERLVMTQISNLHFGELLIGEF